MNDLFYRVYFPAAVWFAGLGGKHRRDKVLVRLIERNNAIVLRSVRRPVRRVLILLPRCIQNFGCKHNVISDPENCKNCGKCKLADIIALKKKYGVDLRVAPGGSLAKIFVKEVDPDYIIAVACNPELMLGIKEVYPYKVLAVTNIIPGKPCISTDVDVLQVEKMLSALI